MVAGGMCGCGGHVWLWGACVVAGGHVWLPGVMYGCRGTCVVAGGHVWLQVGMCGCGGMCMVAGGAWLWEGVRSCGGHVWLPGGACMAVVGACIGYDEIRSMSRQYASYWLQAANITIHKPHLLIRCACA